MVWDVTFFFHLKIPPLLCACSRYSTAKFSLVKLNLIIINKSFGYIFSKFKWSVLFCSIIHPKKKAYLKKWKGKKLLPNFKKKFEVFDRCELEPPEVYTYFDSFLLIFIVINSHLMSCYKPCIQLVFRNKKSAKYIDISM